MIILSLAMASVVAAYGPIIDPRTGKLCPSTEYKLGLWDEPDFSIADLLNTSPNEADYCTKLRYNLLEKQRRQSRQRALKLKSKR